MQNILIDMYEKFHYDRLRNDRTLGNRKSDMNKNLNNKNKNNIRSHCGSCNYRFLLEPFTRARNIVSVIAKSAGEITADARGTVQLIHRVSSQSPGLTTNRHG